MHSIVSAATTMGQNAWTVFFNSYFSFFYFRTYISILHFVHFGLSFEPFHPPPAQRKSCPAYQQSETLVGFSSNAGSLDNTNPQAASSAAHAQIQTLIVYVREVNALVSRSSYSGRTSLSLTREVFSLST